VKALDHPAPTESTSEDQRPQRTGRPIPPSPASPRNDLTTTLGPREPVCKGSAIFTKHRRSTPVRHLLVEDLHFERRDRCGPCTFHSQLPLKAAFGLGTLFVDLALLRFLCLRLQFGKNQAEDVPYLPD
jgi:hypothetical protein